MIIVSDYTQSYKKELDVFLIESREECPCPVCQNPLRHRDWKPRIMKLDGGHVRRLMIERLQCTNEGCRHLHSVLPDMLVPYKHYAAKLITDVPGGVYSARSEAPEYSLYYNNSLRF